MIEWVCLGITFRLSLLFPAAAITLMAWDDSGFILLCLLSSLIHEAGHALAMLIVRDRPRRVTMSIFGVCIERERTCHIGYGASAFVSFAGPLVNVIAFTILWLFDKPTTAVIHAGLALFNLLPIQSLDGGEAVYALLCRRLTEEKASCVLRVISYAVIFPIAVAGFWLLLSENRNFSLLFMSGYLLLLLFFKEKH